MKLKPYLETKGRTNKSVTELTAGVLKRKNIQDTQKVKQTYQTSVKRQQNGFNASEVTQVIC